MIRKEYSIMISVIVAALLVALFIVLNSLGVFFPLNEPVNNLVSGEAMLDFGYLEGECDHNYASVHFQGNVSFIEEFEEKKKALEFLIEKFEKKPEEKNKEFLTEKSIINVKIGKINISYMSGKKNKKAVIE